MTFYFVAGLSTVLLHLPVSKLEDEVKFPTKEELAELPLRHIVAYAARIARRVLPLYDYDRLSSANSDSENAVSIAIETAEYFCKDGVIPVDEAAEAAAEAAEYAGANAAANAAEAAGHAAYAAYAASAGTASDDARAFNADVAANAATNAAEYAVTAVTAVTADTADAADAAMSDYDLLLTLNDEPFDPGPSGPLGPYWPDGKPEWYLDALRSIEEQEFQEVEPYEFLLDTGTASREEIAELFNKLEDLYRAAGGGRLQFEFTDSREPIFVENGS